jgi:tetratricopeptide (TPR) repeat protein
VNAYASIKKVYLSELWDMERGMATPPKPISKTFQLIQTVFEIEPTEVEVACDLGKDELRDATEMIEKANAEIEKLKLEKVERLKAEGGWADAEQTYRQVIELKHAGRGRGNVDDAVVLELGYQMAEMQMKQKKYSDAEATARDVWERRGHLPGEDDSEATRSSRLQLCQGLRGQGVEKKFKEATTMYRGIWCHSTDKHWMIKNGHELGLVLAEQGRFKEASVQHEKVWLERKDVLEPGAIDTVLSLHEWLRILEIQEKPETTSTEKEDPKVIILQKEKVLRLIWEARGGPAERSFDIPARGHELGSMLFRQERFYEAAPILNDVWGARKALPEVSAETLSTGDLLAKAQNSCGELEEAARVYRWICNAREQIPSEDSRLLDSRQRLGHILFQRRRFDESAAECRKVWEPARHNAETSPLTVPETVLKAGLDLALSLEQLENFEEAYQTIELVCKCKRRRLQPQPIPSTFSEALDRIQQRRQAIMPPPLRRQSRPSTPRASSTPRQERPRTSQRRPGRQERCDSRERKPRKKNFLGL